ncbi:MAG: hypothetical protein ABFS17_04220 [Chloroflexota bacterium]
MKNKNMPTTPPIKLRPFFERIQSFLSSTPGNLLIFLVLCVLSYGIFIPFLGYYWDDWGFIWLNEFFGAEGLTSYFSTNRPFWAGMFQFTLGVIGTKPLYWHVFAFTMRLINGIAFWGLLRLIWPKRDRFAFAATLLFLVYPGFSQQAVAITYSHFFIVQLMLILSLITMILALRKRKRAALWWVISLLLAACHQFIMEYFFALEILRVVILWLHFENISELKSRASKVLTHYLPYLAISGLFLYWRVFVLAFQTYQPGLIEDVATNPTTGLLGLVQTVFTDVFATGIRSWFAPIAVLLKSEHGATTNLILFGGILAGGIVTFLSMAAKKAVPQDKKWLFQPIIFALLGLFAAGAPFWLTNLEIGFNSISDRFAFPMMMVASLLLAGIIFYLLNQRPKWINLVVTIFVTLGIGFQLNVMADFRQEWKDQRSIYKQLEWRIPALQPGTLIISPEFDLPHISDNSMTGPINWLFGGAPGGESTEYLLAYVPLRLGGLIPELSPGLPVRKDLLVNLFKGSTSQVITLQMPARGCLRVFDASRDAAYPHISDELRQAIALSEPARWIASQPGGGGLPSDIYAPPAAAESWCFYFQKADLASQNQDWLEITRLGEKAFALNDTPNDATERIPFIQGYAHTGDWETAAVLTAMVLEINPSADRLICDLWAGFQSLPDSAEKRAAFKGLDPLNCTEN